MAVSWKRIFELVPSLVTSVLPGLLAGGAVSRVAGKAAAKKGLAGAVFDYPPMQDDFDYPISKLSNKTWVTGKDGKPHETTLPGMNPNIDYANAEAALVQTIQGHNQAVKNGTEGTMIQWWPAEVAPTYETRPTLRSPCSLLRVSAAHFAARESTSTRTPRTYLASRPTTRRWVGSAKNTTTPKRREVN